MYKITGGSGDMIVQEDTVFISGMDTDATEEDIAEHFGAIGLIKVTFFNLLLQILSWQFKFIISIKFFYLFRARV